METKLKKAIENYQCTGCSVGSDIRCFTSDSFGEGCGKHFSGTGVLGGIGKILLGMPKGFNRMGEQKELRPKIFKSFSDYGSYDKWNIPTWKYKDEFGNTLVRGLMPRRNEPFLHVFLEDCLDQVNCYLVTPEDVEFMDY